MSLILVTGGAGFIGSHLGQRLLTEGHQLRVLDSLDPYYDVALKRRNLELLSAAAAGGGRLEFIEGDLRDSTACSRAVDGVDAVVHLAARAGVRPSIEDPVTYMDVNVTGTQRLLDGVIGRPEVPILFASSSSVYGGNQKVPFAESDPVDHPVSPYAASKKAGEVLCHAFHHLHRNPITCLRFFTVYGPRQRPEMAIHLFGRKILAGEPLPFFGDGESGRDYTYIDDIVDGMMAALQRADGYRIYNLGGSKVTKLADLVRMLEQVFGKAAVLQRLPDQRGDVHQTWADLSLVERDLGYRSKVPIAEGLGRFADWLRGDGGQGS